MVYPKALILYGGFRFKKNVTRVRAVKITLQVYENLTFLLTKYRCINIEKIFGKFQKICWKYEQSKNENADRERFVIANNPKKEKKREKKTSSIGGTSLLRR